MAETSTTGTAGPARRWSDAVRVYREPASLRMFFLGFAAGLPLLLVLGTLSFRLREAGIDRTTIGYLSWVGLAYGIKWAWAPLVDRLPLPGLTRLLGRRRGWLLLAQSGVIAGLVGMALADPRAGLDGLIVVRAARRLLVRHAGHRARCLPHRVGAGGEAGGAGGDVPDRLSHRDDLGRCGRALDRSAFGRQRSRRATARRRGRPRTSRWRPPCWSASSTVLLSPEPAANAQRARDDSDERALAQRLVAERGLGPRAAAVIALAAHRRRRALRRLRRPLPLARAAAAGADRRVSHLGRRDGDHGESVLRRHGLHEGRSRRRVEALRRGDDARGRLRRRRARAALRRDPDPDARRRAFSRVEPAVRVACAARPRPDWPDLHDLGRQPVGRHRIGGLHRLPVEPDQRRVTRPPSTRCSRR